MTETTRAFFRIAMATLLGLSQAHAQPPKDANPIYSPYFKQLKRADQPQWYCCSLETDCREVDQRRNPVTGKWEALISKETFDNPVSNAPDTPTWYEIPTIDTQNDLRNDVAKEDAAQTDPDVGASASAANPYANMSDADLVALAKQQGINADLPTGSDAYVGELKNSFGGAVDLAKSGGSDLARAASPLTALMQYATKGEISPDTLKSIISMAGTGSPLSAIANQVSTAVSGLGKSALGALGAVLSPVDAGVRSYVGNPVQNATGIPTDVTTFATEMLAPSALSKLGSLFKVGEAAAPAESALGKLAPEVAPEASPEPATVQEAAQAASPEVAGATTVQTTIQVMRTQTHELLKINLWCQYFVFYRSYFMPPACGYIQHHQRKKQRPAKRNAKPSAIYQHRNF